MEGCHSGGFPLREITVGPSSGGTTWVRKIWLRHACGQIWIPLDHPNLLIWAAKVKWYNNVTFFFLKFNSRAIRVGLHWIRCNSEDRTVYGDGWTIGTHLEGKSRRWWSPPENLGVVIYPKQEQYVPDSSHIMLTGFIFWHHFYSLTPASKIILISQKGKQ